jgi:hypothetical protein
MREMVNIEGPNAPSYLYRVLEEIDLSCASITKDTNSIPYSFHICILF